MLTETVGSRASVTPTRLHLPRVPGGVVSRGRLVGQAIGRLPVTLVCAPAGSGKTMAVADWATRAVARGEPVAWVSLTDQDDRPFEFWSAVIEALMAAAPPGTAERLDALSPPHHGVEPRFITALTGVVADSDLPWLVLDDVHLLRNPEVVAGLDVLLSEAPPQVGMILVGRFEPAVSLHRLRLSGSLAEVSAPDLAFTEPEAQSLFSSLDAKVQQSEVARLVLRTEGWAAGLRLAAVSVAAADDPVEFISAFEGDERSVADYLFAEIIQHLPQDLVEFLLATCAPEQLSVELAAHLSGRRDAGELLARLCRANALVVQSGESSWYRYHSLLRTYLTAALGRRDVDAPRRQHVSAALWFDQHGEPSMALEHAAQAGDVELLCDLVRENGLRMILSGQSGMVRDAIGRPSQELLGDQRVAIVAVLAALDASDLVAADEWLKVLANRAWPYDSRFAAMRASAIVQRSLLGGDVPAALAESAILDLVTTGDGDVELIVLAYRAPARMRTGDYKGAISDLERALELARSGGYDQFVLWTLSQLAGMNAAICDFEATLEWARQAIAFATHRGWIDSPRLAYAYLVAAWTAFQTGDVPAQAHHATCGLRALDGVNNVEVEVGVRTMHAIATFEATSGFDRLRAAESFHMLWQGVAVDQVSPAMVSLATPQEVRTALAVGRPQWAQEAGLRIERQMPSSAETATVHAQLLAAKGRAREALEVLRPVLEGRIETHVPTTSVLAQVLAASLESSVGNQYHAFDALRSALDWAAPNNYRRPFVDAWDDLEPLLTTHRGRFGAADVFVTGLVDDQRRTNLHGAVVNHTLTDREFDVLRDLPAAMTLSEIATARGVSENTVKTHVRAIYQKLGVSSRSHAVREARSRGLI
jgi:LuxR family transcriptional regulator, maltose regulon positive regulatory protein